MPQHLIEVAFKGNRKEFFLWEGEAPPPAKAAVIVDADRGEDLGHVAAVGELAERRNRGVAHGIPGGTTPKRALRLATEEDVLRAAELASQNEVARRRAMERVKANALVMKLSDAEWQWDRKKLTFFFTAEKRVDFRALVRDLAAMFRTRIELKQIGVRDEAKRLDGIGRCARQYCSASWLPELRPVNLGVAKDQRLSLNPTQISGACGRLMCSLRYEHEFYVQSRKRFPKEGKILVTARGEEKVVANDIFNDRVTLRGPEGETRLVPLAELKRELASLGTELPEPTAAHVSADAPEHDELPPEEGLTSLARGGRADAPRGGQRPAPRPERPRPERANGERAAGGGEPAARPEERPVTSRPDPLRTLPVVNVPAPEPAAREAARLLEQVAPDTEEGDDEGIEDDVLAEDDAIATNAAEAAGGERRPRRRRGRRGGRRGRGSGGDRPAGGGTTTSSDTPAPDSPSTD